MGGPFEDEANALHPRMAVISYQEALEIHGAEPTGLQRKSETMLSHVAWIPAELQRQDVM